MTRKILGLAAVLLALSTSAAPAEPFTPEDERLYQEALAWWGVSTPPGCTEITKSVEPLPGETLGEATVPPSGELVACEILLAPNLPPCLAPEVERHEVGHLLGLGHSVDPKNIMYPYLSGTRCVLQFFRDEVTTGERELRELLHRCRRQHWASTCHWDVSLTKWEVRDARRHLSRWRSRAHSTVD